MREIIKMIVVLSAICAIAGLLLSGLKAGTAQRIEEQVLTYVQGPALLSVFTDVDNDPIAERKKFAVPGSDEEVTVFPAIKDGKLVGVALEQFSGGYGGPVGIMVGISTEEEKLVGIGVTTMKETPGLGTKAAEPEFSGQFIDHPLDPIELSGSGGSIDAISGATITSNAAVTATRKAVKIYSSLKDEIGKTW